MKTTNLCRVRGLIVQLVIKTVFDLTFQQRPSLFHWSGLSQFNVLRSVTKRLVGLSDTHLEWRVSYTYWSFRHRVFWWSAVTMPARHDGFGFNLQTDRCLNNFGFNVTAQRSPYRSAYAHSQGFEYLGFLFMSECMCSLWSIDPHYI